MNANETLCAASLCVAASLALIWKWQRSGVKLPLPPGPTRLPLLGNVLDIPKDVPIWQAFISIARKHSKCLLLLLFLRCLVDAA